MLSARRRLIRLQLLLVLLTGIFPLSMAAQAPMLEDTTQHSSSSHLADELDGLLTPSRIIGGRDAQANSWPSLVALVTPGNASVKNRFFCGATVIASRWVLTAAHCLYNSKDQLIQPSRVRVIAGIRNLETDVPEEEVIVTNIVVHPQFNNSIDLPPFDIAVLELGSVINAPIVSLFAGDTADFNGITSSIVGWGAVRFVDETDITYPSQLQEAAVPIVPLDRCNSIVSYQNFITHRQVCAGFVDGGVDSCVGDSGGPLFIVEDGEFVQMGITSFGNQCALPNFYGIYTSVSHLLPWLSGFVVVPFQTPELVARLDAGLPRVDPFAEIESEREGLFFGASNPLTVGLMLMGLLCRRRRAL